MPSSNDNVRLRAVSGASMAVPEDDEIASLIGDLRDVDVSSWSKLMDALSQTACLQQLRYRLKEDGGDNNPRDVFRRAGGFQATLLVIKSFSNVLTEKSSETDVKALIQVLAQTLAVLEAALEQHAGNNRYFRSKLSPSGWSTVEHTLSGILQVLQKLETKDALQEQLFGVLFATVVGQDMLQDIYSSVSKTLSSLKDGQSAENTMLGVERALSKNMEGVHDIAMPDLLPLMLALKRQVPSEAKGQQKVLGLAFPLSIKRLLEISRQNIVQAHTAGLLSEVIPLLFSDALTPTERALFRSVGLLLCQEGLSNLDDAYALFSEAANSTSAVSFLLEAIPISRQPASIQFDLSRTGFSSVELASLRKPFPTPDTSGYTFSLWARFDEFDDSSHTTLFGAFDRTQTCFILAYLERESHHMILQTSVKGSRPSVRFKSVHFETNQWYHIAIVHKKPRTTTAARALLFVNGEFCEQVKSIFPVAPPSDRNRVPQKIQAFFGTPQDLSPANNGNSCTSRWSLASAMLFQNTLSEDLLAVIFHLGPRYHGNLQDCLGSFQTYAASAALNLRNESLNPGAEDSSHLIMATRQKASTVLGEDLVLLNISPASVLDADDRNSVDESQLIRSLSKLAAKNLAAYTRSGANAIAINGAVPAINDALVQSNGVAMLIGEPTVTVPQSIDDISWRLGGCAPIGLGLIQRARNTEEVLNSTRILLETIKNNWRNSEVMERNNGYSVMSGLLRDKLTGTGSAMNDGGRPALAIPTPSLDRSGLSVKLLEAILSFLGYDEEDESKSIINNPLAYKILLIDSDTWRTLNIDVQRLYFRQFVVFVELSRFAKFNLKRLHRMRALRRLLEVLKAEVVPRNVMPMYSTTFKLLLPHCLSAEMLRSIALFITFSVHKRSSLGRTRKPARSRASSRSGGGSPTRSDTLNLSQFEIGVEILRVYSDMLCTKGDQSLIKRFAKTVTNKWLLYLLSETSPEVVVLSLRILARLLVVHGESYVKKFKEKSGGFSIMCHRLKRWWHLPALWPACFAVLFDVDVADLDLDRSFDLFSFVDLFDSKRETGVVYPEMLEVIMGMLQTGLKTIVTAKQQQQNVLQIQAPPPNQPPERLSMSTMAPPNPFLTIITPQHVDTFNTVIQFLADLQSRSAKFRYFVATSSYVQDLLFVLFPVVVGADVVEASVELNARDSMLSFDGADVVMHPLVAEPPVVRTNEPETDPVSVRGKNLRRGSSFVLVTKEANGGQGQSPEQDKKANGMAMKVAAENASRHAIVQSVLEIIVSLFVDQILTRKDFAGLGLFLKTPPGFIEHQSYFESWILRNTISELSNAIALDQVTLSEPKVLTNLARFFTHLGDSVFEGWFIDGAEPVLDLAASILEYLQRPDIAKLKSVRLCAQPILVIRTVVFRLVLLSLSELKDAKSLSFLKKLAYWQNVLLSTEDSFSQYLQLICYLLYRSLISPQERVRSAAADLWRIILVQKPDETAAIMSRADTVDQKRLVASFEKLVELDNESFFHWMDEHRAELDALFFQTLSLSWDEFVDGENKKTEEMARGRVLRRREKLKGWAREESGREDLIQRHEVTFDHWTTNIYSSENLKHQRLMQDQQDDFAHTQAQFARMQRELTKTTGLFQKPASRKWRVDQTEGRNRMRLRLMEDDTFEHKAQPKRKGSDIPALRLDTRGIRISSAEAIGITPGGDGSVVDSPTASDMPSEPFPSVSEKDDIAENVEAEDSFELIEDPNAGQDEFEDKNRKVMRSLHRGDQVKHVANISRIAGLEAIEGLLILGKEYIYLIDNFFQRADGEIVNVWQAPAEERDSYVSMISGRDVTLRKPAQPGDEHHTRSWKWMDVISISKRRFLFRDVAIEMFFGDGRSYLLTVMDPKTRNDLCSLINAKAPQYGSPDSPHSEVAWRYEALKSADDEPQTFGARFANVFVQSSTLVATRKWQRGEMSNFHYLMLINTLAGRTYNDLTQYPVFPWVIADYTSEELDLTDPRSFRDLSKPMGCQTPEREAEFRDRFKQFAEMGDTNAPPFHYGTHYSSAMIVTSYLVRLQPFVKSYLLLQGGTFDHPDRMFFSVEGAWRSASKMNMTDVRELTPEFYYLPEFLTNPNDYDFGNRQNTTKSIGVVELPPWAKNDPKIFISKQREALESPIVSKNLHKWIDLIFGCKQKGEAAVEAANVFHHLSYQGAKDLDTIDDPVERLATIGIIHNFGQTPLQVFQRTHPAREQTKHRYKRLDSAAESLTRIPGTLLDSEERISSLAYSWKADKLLCSGAFRLNIPPNYDRYMEWGFSDNSVRFYAADSRRQIGLFEHLHIGQLSCALFADSKTLITSGTDCTVAVWSLSIANNGKGLDLLPKATLFGHHKAVTTLALSRSFNALLSCSNEGELMLWDLSRCELVRKIESAGIPAPIECATINDVTGNIVICNGSWIQVMTLNGDLVLCQNTSENHNTVTPASSPTSSYNNEDKVISVACYEGASTEWLERDIIFTGHKRGVVKVWNKVISRDGGFELELIRQLNHVDPAREDGGNVNAGISCILPMPQVVYTGDEDGRVVEWNCVQRH